MKTCPKCGSDELGVNVLVSECRDIHDPSVVHSRVDTDMKDVPAYTCKCGHEFEEPVEVTRG